jgi:hypothetical protein
MRFNGWTLFSLALLVLGVAFWLYMGVAFGSAGDVGVYAVGMTLVAFGLLGALVSLARPRTA